MTAFEKSLVAFVTGVLTSACSTLLPFVDISESDPVRCANGIDDDLDGNVDCDDPDCDGLCSEGGSSASCSNCRDEDGDGMNDHADLACWGRARMAVGELSGSETRRCSSRSRSMLRLADGEEPWLWSCGGPSPCPPDHPWVPDPGGGTQRVARLEGGAPCRGAGILSGACAQVIGTSRLTGGVCWTLEADVLLDGPESELALVIAPEVASPPLIAPSAALVVGVERTTAADGRTLLAITYRAEPGRRARAAALGLEGWLRLRVEATARGPGGCTDAEQADVSVRLIAEDDDVLVLDREGDEPLQPPQDWAPDAPLHMGMQAAAPGRVWVRGVTMVRERFDPCGFSVPQIMGDDDGGAVVVGAARGGGLVCAIGATTSGPEIVRHYEPRRHFAWWPELREGDPPAPRRRFGSWRTSDRGIASFGPGADIVGPARSAALDHLSVRSGELAWSAETGFEGVLLVSEEPRRGGRLVRVSSPDCATWTVDPIVGQGMSASGEQGHPLLHELGPRRLVLGHPGIGYTAPDDPRCTNEPECPGDPPVCFVAPADAVPYIKPVRGDCMTEYPRATLTEERSDDGVRWSSSPAGSLPALPRWVLGCGCLGGFVSIPPRGSPAEVAQLLEVGNDRIVLVTSSEGLELVYDEDPRRERASTIADGTLLPGSLLVPTGIAGTFDAARVAEGHLLILGPRRASPMCPVEALLFYRGFHESDRRGDIVEHGGGHVGVIPVRIAPSNPERLVQACNERPDAGSWIVSCD